MMYKINDIVVINKKKFKVTKVKNNGVYAVELDNPNSFLTFPVNCPLVRKA